MRVFTEPHLVEKIKGFPLRVKSFEILQHIKNSREGFHQPPSLPLLYQGEGMALPASPRVKLNFGENCLYGNLVSPNILHSCTLSFSVINLLHVLVRQSIIKLKLRIKRMTLLA